MLSTLFESLKRYTYSTRRSVRVLQDLEDHSRITATREQPHTVSTVRVVINKNSFTDSFTAAIVPKSLETTLSTALEQSR